MTTTTASDLLSTRFRQGVFVNWRAIRPQMVVNVTRLGQLGLAANGKRRSPASVGMRS